MNANELKYTTFDSASDLCKWVNDESNGHIRVQEICANYDNDVYNGVVYTLFYYVDKH